MTSASKRAVVTGAASGIGRAATARLLAEGVAVLAVDINQAGLDERAAAGCATMAADLADPATRDRLAEAADGYDYLVNAAGIIMLKSVFDVSVEEWRRIQTVNAESTFFLCQKIGPRLRSGGAIVNLSSSSAKLATTVEAGVYAASKTTILSITRSFAYALADRPVRVNAVCPGLIDTPMQHTVLKNVATARNADVEELSRARNRSVPMGRMGTPEEVANLIWFLLSDEAAYMTGQAVNVSGGWIMW
jgi:NAD(P)-dependent dehydrogenase (short-subunit alcohol dehydrogenase family)